MKKFIQLIELHYQDLVDKCEMRKIAVNLDFQTLNAKLSDENALKLEKFLQIEIARALKNCKAGDKITLSESETDDFMRVAVKNSGAGTLSADEKAQLTAKGYEVRARFGYDTIVAIKLKKND